MLTHLLLTLIVLVLAIAVWLLRDLMQAQRTLALALEVYAHEVRAWTGALHQCGHPREEDR